MSAQSAFDLTDKVAVVTGGSRGLGLAEAHALAAAGATVAILARDQSRLEVAAKEVREASGRPCLAVQVDVGDQDRVEAAFTQVHHDLGAVDILVNNAAIQHQAPVSELSSPDWQRVLDVNVGGILACTAAFVSRAHAGACIINVSSIAASVGVGHQAVYTASKGAVSAVTRALAVELARSGIRVNAVSPGYFATEMPRWLTSDPERHARLLRKIPMRRLGDPDEIGPTVVFLASPASSYMTGTIVSLDGGYTAL